jgi:hypothetical protein
MVVLLIDVVIHVPKENKYRTLSENQTSKML